MSFYRAGYVKENIFGVQNTVVNITEKRGWFMFFPNVEQPRFFATCVNLH